MNHTNPSSDDALFSLLNDYVDRLHAGEPVDRDRLRREHPELDSALDCLDVLDSFVREVPDDPIAREIVDGTAATDDEGLSDAARRQFGPYELIEEIGRGGMGIVYKARQTALDRTVAVKMILASHVESIEHLRRFQAEAKAAARLQHPNIVHIHEVGQLHGRHFFAMELIDGVSLAQRLAQGPMDTPEIVRLVAATARAIAELHHHGIVHRDLKPSNILLDAEGHPHVTDFGLAKIFESDATRTATGVIAGTPSYMSPEQAAGRNELVGPASDVYSLGAILYELLTGRPPFREPTPVETVLHVLSREPELPRRFNSKVPRALEQVCLKCLAKSPEARYGSADDLADDLDRFARGEPLAAKMPGWTERVRRWTRRQPALASRLGALAVFYSVELVNYYHGAVDQAFHWEISLLVALWAGMSIGFQQFVARERWAVPACFGWGTLDAVFLLAALLFLADGVASPLVIGYPLLIVASGLWFRVRFVSYMTLLSLFSYGVLVVDFYYRRPYLAEHFDTAIDRHILFAVALVVEAAVVSYLVHRLRTMSRYLGQ
ncbi:MAG: serine/threonine protein kinase [Pirellulales bacterium]|nr:serine/threonine protein kinase [Pirellulales bacterium]